MSLNEPSDLLQKPPKPSRAIMFSWIGLHELGKDLWTLQQHVCPVLNNANMGSESGTQPPSHCPPVNLCLCVVKLGVFVSGWKKCYLDAGCLSKRCLK